MLWQTTKRSQRPMPRGFACLHIGGLHIDGLHMHGRPASGSMFAAEGNESTTGRIRA